MAKKNIINKAKELISDKAKREVIHSISINNGKLTAEKDIYGNTNWYRNGKKLSDKELSNYKYYDPNIKAYRTLNLKKETIYNPRTDEEYTQTVASTPVYSPNYDRLGKSGNPEIYKEDVKQGIALPKGGKEYTLRTKGRNNLVDIPESLLDSVAINTGRSKTDFFTNLALISQESSFGNKSHYLGRDNYDFNSITENERGIFLSPHDLTNNHSYYTTGELDYLAAVGRKFPEAWKSGDISLTKEESKRADKQRIAAEKDIEYAYKHSKINKGNTPHYSNNIMTDAFIRNAKDPQSYNPNEKRRASIIEQNRQELSKEKQLQEYWNTRGKKFYNKGVQDGIEPYKYDEGGPLGTKQAIIGNNPHNKRQYIKPEYIPFLEKIERDNRGHMPDEVKGKDHPSGSSYGKFLNNLQFEIKDPANINYVREGLNDNGDYKATVTYKGSTVLPEITITPNGNYIEDSYNNIKFLYAKGGWMPSKETQVRIAAWEGSSMYSPAPDTHKVNNSFEKEAKGFRSVIPKETWDVLSEDEKNALYSLSYNIGCGAFKQRVVPTLNKYAKGKATAADVAACMYGTKDNDPELQGLSKRRAIERNLFGAAAYARTGDASYLRGDAGTPVSENGYINTPWGKVGLDSPMSEDFSSDSDMFDLASPNPSEPVAGGSSDNIQIKTGITAEDPEEVQQTNARQSGMQAVNDLYERLNTVATMPQTTNSNQGVQQVEYEGNKIYNNALQSSLALNNQFLNSSSNIGLLDLVGEMDAMDKVWAAEDQVLENNE